MNRDQIIFNKPYMTGKELYYISQAHLNGKLSGDGPFTKSCHTWIEKYASCARALLTHSCTAALEMAAFLLNIKPGDEIIMPSYTFVSTANSFVLRGGIPVFVDIREDTLNIDEKLIESAITHRTKAIVPVHYAGVGCEMDTIMRIANKHNIAVVEDAAQGIMSKYKGKALGSIGHLGAYSFHETKNIISGEGGCLLVNASKYIERAEIIREKGTDRGKFFRGEVDKYTWRDVGSSYLPGELTAAFLWAQLEESESITSTRTESWKYYHDQLKWLENEGVLRRPTIPIECAHNAHMYYVLLATHFDRQVVLKSFKDKKINAIFHYVPLHSSSAGLKYGRIHGELSNTEEFSGRILRLPLWVGITIQQQQRVVEALKEILIATR